MKTNYKKRAVSLLLILSLLCGESMVSAATETEAVAQETSTEASETSQEALVDSSNDSSEDSSAENSTVSSDEISEDSSKENSEDNSEDNSEEESRELSETEIQEDSETDENLEDNEETESEEEKLEDDKETESEEEKLEDEEELEEDSDVIVSVKELEPVITEYKLAYISLKKRFPSTIIGYKKDETEVELGVSKWNPVSDYNEMLGTYSFAPVIDGHYEIDEEISLPEITVKVENEEMPTTGIADPETEVDKDEDKKPAKKGILSNLFIKVKSFVVDKITDFFSGEDEDSLDDSEYTDGEDCPEYEDPDCPDCPEYEDPDCPDCPEYEDPDCPDCPEYEDPDCPDCPEYEDPDCPDCPEYEDPDCPDCPEIPEEKEIYEGPGYELPSAYNGYEQGDLPAVRNQGSYGTCWAHAAVGAIETDVINRNTCVDSSFDLSEYQLAYYCAHYYDDPKDCHDNDKYTIYPDHEYLDDGGHASYIYSLMYSGVGAVPESVVPYLMAGEELDQSYAMDYNCVRLESVNQIKTSERDNVKDAILKHGSVYTLVCTNEEYFDWMEDSMYNDSKESSMPDHAVTIVGWDDNFPASNFKINAPGNGAWLIRNSWGLDDYGMNGYFWVSYYDEGINWTGQVVAFSTSLHPYDNTYTYASSIFDENTYVDKETAVVSTDYKVNAGETIEAVATYVNNAFSEIDVEVEANGKKAKGHFSNKYKGVYTIHLDNPIEVKKDTVVKVSVSITDKNNGWVSVPLDYSYIVMSESYEIDNPVDNGCTINGEEYDADPKIYLYTNNKEEDPSVEHKGITVEQNHFLGHKDETFQILMGEDSVVKDASEITWESRNPEVASVDENGLVTINGKKGSSAIIGTYDSYRIVLYAETEPYKVEFVFDDDVEKTVIPEYYYPGDFLNSNYPSGRNYYKKGYIVYEWFLDKELTKPIPDGSLEEMTGDLVLYPKWGYSERVLSYQTPNGDLKTYSDDICYIDVEINIDEMPYKIPANDAIDINPEIYIDEDSNMEFAYWSLDPEGEKPVTEITEDQLFKCKYNSYTKEFITPGEITIYPQYREKKADNKAEEKPEAPEKAEEKAFEHKAEQENQHQETSNSQNSQQAESASSGNNSQQNESILSGENTTVIEQASVVKPDNKKSSGKKHVKKKKQTKKSSKKRSKKSSKKSNKANLKSKKHKSKKNKKAKLNKKKMSKIKEKARVKGKKTKKSVKASKTKNSKKS